MQFGEFDDWGTNAEFKTNVNCTNDCANLPPMYLCFFHDSYGCLRWHELLEPLVCIIMDVVLFNLNIIMLQYSTKQSGNKIHVLIMQNFLNYLLDLSSKKSRLHTRQHNLLRTKFFL